MSTSVEELLNAFSDIELSSTAMHKEKITKEEELQLKAEVRQRIEKGKAIGPSSKSYFHSDVYEAEIWGYPVPQRLSELRRTHEVVRGASCQCRIAKYPFSHGSVRTAYYGYVRMAGSTQWTKVILKEFIVPHERTENQYAHQSDNSAVASYLVKHFSEIYKSKKTICAIRSRILKVTIGGRKVLYNMEENLRGSFKKWTNNAGNIFEVNKSLVELAKWSHIASGGYLLLSDLQGVETDKKITLTDPAVLCVDLSRFGPTNIAPAQMTLCLEALEKCTSCPELEYFRDTVRAPGMSILGDEILTDSIRMMGGSGYPHVSPWMSKRPGIFLRKVDDTTLPPSSDDDCFQWMRRAVLLGDTEAWERLCSAASNPSNKMAVVSKGLGLTFKPGLVFPRLDIPEGARMLRPMLPWLEERTKNNDVCVYSLWILGTLYRHGDVVEHNETLSFQLLHRAAEKGFPAALSTLGDMYGKLDKEKALMLANEAVDKGEKYDAKIILGVLLLGNGDVSKGRKFIRQAADEGNLFACFFIAMELGKEGNFRESFPYLRHAGQRGLLNAFTSLGHAYFAGKGTSVNKTEGIKYWKKGVEYDDPDLDQYIPGHSTANCCLYLGLKYVAGDTVPVDREKGVNLIRRAVGRTEVAEEVLRSIAMDGMISLTY